MATMAKIQLFLALSRESLGSFFGSKLQRNVIFMVISIIFLFGDSIQSPVALDRLAL
jgi:hypothetical protein